MSFPIPNWLSLIMLMMMLCLALSYSLAGIRPDYLNKGRFMFFIAFILGSGIGGAIGFGLAILSRANHGEFWELWAALLGCVIGGAIAAFFYARYKSGQAK